MRLIIKSLFIVISLLTLSFLFIYRPSINHIIKSDSNIDNQDFTSRNSNMSEKYIVVFKDSVTEHEGRKQEQEIVSNGGQLAQPYNQGVLNYLVAHLTPTQVDNLKKTSKLIDYIEKDSTVSTQ